MCTALKASTADKKDFKQCLEMAHKFLMITQVCWYTHSYLNLICYIINVLRSPIIPHDTRSTTDRWIKWVHSKLVNTCWAVLALMAVQYPNIEPIKRGVKVLVVYINGTKAVSFDIHYHLDNHVQTTIQWWLVTGESATRWMTFLLIWLLCRRILRVCLTKRAPSRTPVTETCSQSGRWEGLLDCTPMQLSAEIVS